MGAWNLPALATVPGTIYFLQKVRGMTSPVDAVIVELSEAIGNDPNNAVLYYRRGCAWHRMNENQKAIADYDEAIRLDPECAAAHSDRGVAFLHLGDEDRALYASFADARRAFGVCPCFMVSMP